MSFVTTFSLLLSPDAAATNSVWILDIKGPIGPATADYIMQEIDNASSANVHLIVIQIDTPGGLDLSMRDIIKTILASHVPVASYVYPSGSRAASAGTYILYASHIAAMAPATNLGAATPVQIVPPTLPSNPQDPNNTSDQPLAKSAMEKKVINDAVAYIQGLASLRGRNIEWAALAVQEGSSLSAKAALEQNVIDILADNTPSLMTQLHGRTIQLETTTVMLDTLDVEFITKVPGWRSEFLSVITNPNIAYVLMLTGLYGLLFEFYNPGVGVPGIVGGICLLLALYAFQVLPVNYAGLALIALGIMLMVAEAFAPSFGALGLGGMISFVVGSIILMDTPLPAYQIALPLVFALALVSAAFFILIIGLAIRARNQKQVAGLEALQGAQATVEYVSKYRPMVRLNGELWQVNSDNELCQGDHVKVLSAEGVYLKVKKKEG